MSPASMTSKTVTPHLPNKDSPQTIPVTEGSAAGTWPQGAAWPPAVVLLEKPQSLLVKENLAAQRKRIFPVGCVRIQHFK